MKHPLFLLIGVLLVSAAAAAVVMYARVHRAYRGYSEPAQYVEIPQGAGTRAIGDRLVAAGVVRDRLTYRVALGLSGTARHLQAGEYRFDREMTPLEVLGKIARGEVDVTPVTFPEGLTITEMAAIFADHGFGSSQEFIDAARDASLITALDALAKDLEGYLFPDTYLLPRRADAPWLVRAMVERFTKIATTEFREAARRRGLTVRQWVTLASLVEKETGKSEERPVVAAVYEHRLRIGMGLQCDPTVIYALQRAGTYTGNLRREDLAFDSPYNTYRHAGLPPGPIASPGKRSLEGVLYPADVDYLYFVSRNDGSHEFARTLDEHNRNVQRFQVQYFRDLRAGRAGRR